MQKAILIVLSIGMMMQIIFNFQQFQRIERLKEIQIKTLKALAGIYVISISKK